jgi:hypothetical protein
VTSTFAADAAPEQRDQLTERHPLMAAWLAQRQRYGRLQVVGELMQCFSSPDRVERSKPALSGVLTKKREAPPVNLFYPGQCGIPACRRRSDRAHEPSQLASDLQGLGINLPDLQVRIETAADLETLPLTDARLQEIEEVRAAVAALEDVTTGARNRAVTQAVGSRWTYQRIRRATGLSISRIGQIAPARAGRDPEANAATPKPKAKRQSK